MQRVLRTSDEIQAEVSRLIQADAIVTDDGEEVHVPRPRLRPSGAAEDACNWTMRSFGNASAYESAVAGALAEVQARWDLDD